MTTSIKTPKSKVIHVGLLRNLPIEEKLRILYQQNEKLLEQERQLCRKTEEVLYEARRAIAQ